MLWFDRVKTIGSEKTVKKTQFTGKERAGVAKGFAHVERLGQEGVIKKMYRFKVHGER